MATTTPILEQPERYHLFSARRLAIYPNGTLQWPRADMSRAFDRKACLRLAVAMRHRRRDRSSSCHIDIQPLTQSWPRIDGVLSREEVAFWFSLLLHMEFVREGADAEPLTEHKVLGMLGHIEATDDHEVYCRAMCEAQVFTRHEALQRPLARLLREVMPYDQALVFLIEHVDVTLLGAWLEQLGPPPEEAREAAKGIIIEMFEDLDDKVWLDVGEHVDLHINISTILSIIPCDRASDDILTQHIRDACTWEPETIRMALAMEDKERALEHFKHVKRGPYHLSQREEVYMFFSRYGFAHTEVLLKSVMSGCESSSVFEDLFACLFAIKSPEFVVLMYDALDHVSLAEKIRAYAFTHERYALEGLLRMCRRRGKRRDWAFSLMRAMIDRDEQVALDLRALASSHPRRIQEFIEQEFFRGSEIDARASIDYAFGVEDEEAWMMPLTGITWPEGGSPAWLCVTSLPPVFLRERSGALPLGVVDGICALCKWVYHGGATPLPETSEDDVVLYRENAQAWLDAFVAATEASSREHLAMTIFRGWIATKEEVESDWVVPLILACGGAMVFALDHHIRATRRNAATHSYPCGGEHIIDALQGMDTSEARYVLLKLSCYLERVPSRRRVDLMWLEDAEYRRHEPLRERSNKLVNKYKYDMCISDDNFLDLAVPEFGLDRGGSHVFDFGSRQIKMTVKGRHDFVFIDAETRRIFQRFPPSRKTDDLDRYNSAHEQYVYICDALRSVFIEQNLRMKRAMLVGRKWKSTHWRQVVCQHPILGHIARRLVWKVLDVRGEVLAHVLLDAEGTCVDIDFEEVNVEKDHRLALMHPANIPKEELDRWAERFADFEIIQPFEQFDPSVTP